MKLSQVLLKQHKGRLARFIWQIQCERQIIPTKAEKILSAMNIKIEDPVELVRPPKQVFEKVEDFGESLIYPRKQPETSENEHARSAFIFNNKHVLQAGVAQARLLTKTLLISEELPAEIEEMKQSNPEINHSLVERIIETSSIFDAHQEKLPKLKDPERPSWVFPRVYGITRARKMNSLARKLVQQCEILCGPEIAQHRNIVQHGYLSATLNHGPDLLNLETPIDYIITSTMPLKSLKQRSGHSATELPDLHPIHHMLGLSQSKTYKEQVVYPIHHSSLWMTPHTIILHYDPETVKNITELPVTEEQVFGQALMRTFATAACYARKKFGEGITELPEPVTVQCIHTDGQLYNFGIFQLNTLNLDRKDGLMNYWWFTPSTELYRKAQYEQGKPEFSGYNPAVFETILAFYKNQSD